MLKLAQKAENDAPAGRVVKLPSGRFSRDPASFATMPSTKEGGD
jgi:hypothetical protein